MATRIDKMTATHHVLGITVVAYQVTEGSTGNWFRESHWSDHEFDYDTTLLTEKGARMMVDLLMEDTDSGADALGWDVKWDEDVGKDDTCLRPPL